MCFNTATKSNVRICSVPGCNNLTHHKRLVCDEHLGLHVNPKDFTREDQTVVTLDANSTSALNRIHEITHPRTWNNISYEQFVDELDKAALVISERSGIDYNTILTYATEKRNNARRCGYKASRRTLYRGENRNWRDDY